MLSEIAGTLLGGSILIISATIFIQAPTPKPHIISTAIGSIGVVIASICGLTLLQGHSNSLVIDIEATAFFVLTYIGFSAVFWKVSGIGTWPPKYLSRWS